MTRISIDSNRLSLILRRGRDDLRRSNHLFTSGLSSLNRRQAQTDNDTELVSHSINEANIRASIVETQVNLEELKQKFNSKKTSNDTTETRQSRKFTDLQKVLQTPACLDETAITMNFLTRRLLCDMFDIPLFKDLLKTKIELKLKEIAVRKYSKVSTKFKLFALSGFDLRESPCRFTGSWKYIPSYSQSRAYAMEYTRHLGEFIPLLSRKYQVEQFDNKKT